MAAVNIPRDVKDEFYRYKMPSIIAKVEGRGNGIKTVIVNMADVAKSLERPPSYPTKFFGFELGAITTIEPANDKYIVNGKHDQSKLAQVLDDFIEKFILCKKCQRNPETYMVIRNGLIELKCKACGGRSPVDMRHKLCTFILKNPPPEEKKMKKIIRKTTPEEEDGAERVEETKEERRLRRKKEKEQQEDEDDVVWYTDTSKEAAEQRRKEMLDTTSELAAKLLNTGLAERPDPLVSMHTFLETKPTNDKIVEQLNKEREEHKLNDEQVARLAFMALFDANVFKQIKTDKMDVIKKFTTNADGQAGVLGGLTELSKDADIIKAVPHVLKHLYDEDIVEEEVFLKWHAGKFRGEAAKVKDASKVFIKWLQTAEEEESEEEDDEDEEDEDEDEEDEDESEEEDEDEDEEESEEEEEEEDEDGVMDNWEEGIKGGAV